MSAEYPGSACLVCPHAQNNLYTKLHSPLVFYCCASTLVPMDLNMLLGAGLLPSEWARIQNISELSLSYNNISGTLAYIRLMLSMRMYGLPACI